MELDHEDGNIKWFRFVHNGHYEKLERCFETALNFGKLIFTMDPQRDPLAVMLIIDTVAIKAKQYTWLKTLYQTAKVYFHNNYFL
uniref:MULE domain-containing protein n=1 Tax=Heterorhabditis bacteriophora TaxID=37862 RepID=A0A1I7WP07_HETBA